MSQLEQANLKADQRAFGIKVTECLKDRRISEYFARDLVDKTDITQSLATGEAFSDATRNAHYKPYNSYRDGMLSRPGQSWYMLPDKIINSRTLTIILGIAITVLVFIGTLLQGNFAVLGAMFISDLSGVIAAFLFGYALETASARVPRFAASAFILSISLVAIILPHLVSGVRWSLIGSFVTWPIAVIVGYIFHVRPTDDEMWRLFLALRYGIVGPFQEHRLSRWRDAWLQNCVEPIIIPQAILAINTVLGEDKDRLLVEQDSEGLRRLQDPSFTVPTLSERRISSLLSQMDGGSIALAGPRGAGKSTLLRKFSSPLSAEARLSPAMTIYLTAPAEYVPRDFIAEFLQQLCKAYLDEQNCSMPKAIYKERRVFGFRRAVHVVFGVFWLLLRTAAAVSIIVWLAWPFIKSTYPHPYTSIAMTFHRWHDEVQRYVLAQWEYHKVYVRAGITLFALILLPGPRLWRKYVRRRKEPALAKVAREYLLRLQVEKTVTWGAGLRSPAIRGMGFNVSRGGSASYSPWTLPELVGYTRRFLYEISMVFEESNHAVVVGIDEIDRIGTLEQAERFIGEIKAIFGVERCFFLVAVAEDVGTIFAQRATAGRSILENAFDDIVVVEPLSLDETRDLLLKRVPGFTDSFVYLVHALSGGLPRELIRVTRRLVEINQILWRAFRHPRLEDLARALVNDEVNEAIRATRSQMSRLTLDAHWASFFERLHSASTTLRRVSVPSMRESHDLMKELSELEFAEPFMQGINARSAVGEDEDAAKRIVSDFSAFAYFGMTVIDAFSDRFFDLEKVQDRTLAGGKSSYEELALARAELTMSPASSRAMLQRFREIMELQAP